MSHVPVCTTKIWYRNVDQSFCMKLSSNSVLQSVNNHTPQQKQVNKQGEGVMFKYFALNLFWY